MHIKNAIFMTTLLLFVTGCYGELRGKVVDAKTGEPIEGAVAMAEWTKTKGLGNTYTVSVKVVEAVSDEEGNVELAGCWCPFANKPSLTIYKKGYVAWNNILLFPSRKVREGLDWKSGQVFRMEKFVERYTHTAHVQFIRQSIGSTIKNKEKENIRKAFIWETKLSIEE